MEYFFELCNILLTSHFLRGDGDLLLQWILQAYPKDEFGKYPFVILVEGPLAGLTKWYILSCMELQPTSATFSFSEKAEYSFLRKE